jgi:hypothetical protein
MQQEFAMPMGKLLAKEVTEGTGYFTFRSCLYSL